LGDRAAGRFIDGLLYESVTDPAMRATLVESHGFCPTHSRRLVGHHDALGSAIIYRSVLKHLEEELASLSASEGKGMMARLRGSWGRESESPLDSHAPCPACLERERAAERALSTFGANHREPELQKALDQSPGLCLPHLRQALGALEPPALSLLLQRQQAAWAALHGELDELIRKYDHRYRDEKIGAEKDAWERAVRLTVGETDVF
jgi:hypothetical protein